MATDLDTTASGVLACVCAALADAGRPVCACYQVVGPPIVGTNCCECDDGGTGEATVYFEQMYDADPTTLQKVSRVHPCRQSTTVADLTVVVTRCYPTIGDDGELPDPDDVDEAASSVNADVCSIWNAVSCGCDLDANLLIRSVAVDSMPEAGCAAIAARLTVEVRC